LSIGNSVDKNQGKGEYFPKGVEYFVVGGVKISSGVLPDQLN